MPATSEDVNMNSATTETVKDLPKFKSCASEINSHLNLLQVARAHNDRRLVSRVLQHLPAIRRTLTSKILKNLLESSNVSSNI